MHTYKCAVRSKKCLGRTKTDVDLAMTWDMPILSTFFFLKYYGALIINEHYVNYKVVRMIIM